MTDPHLARYLPFLPPSLVGAAAAAPVPRSEWLDIGGGTTLHLFRHPAHGTPTATFVVLHGAGGHGRMLGGLGLIAQRLGATAVAPDLPGYGHTVVADRRAVRYDDWIDAAAAVVAAEPAGRPVVIVGASMGGRLAVDVARRLGGRIGAVVATCLLDPRLAEVRAVVAHHPLLLRLGLPAMRATSMISDRLLLPIRWVAPISAIANAPGLAATCRRDPLGAGGSIPLGFLRTWLDHQPVYEPETFDACPVTLAHPGADRWTPVEVSRRWFDRLRVDKRFVLLEGCGHFPVEQPGIDQLAATLRQVHDQVVAG